MFAEVLDTPLTLNYLKKYKENFIKTLVAVFEKVQNGVDIQRHIQDYDRAVLPK